MALTNEDLQAISNLMDNKLQPINGRLDKMDERLDKMDARFDKIENRLDKIESEVSSVKANQLELSKAVREVKHKVDDTYELALEAWGKSTENRAWLAATN